MREQLTWLQVLAILGSLGVHAVAYGALGMAGEARPIGFGTTEVDFEVVAPPLPTDVAETPPLETEDEPEPEPEPVEAARPAVAESEPESEPPPERVPAEESEPQPVDLTGVTLTNDGPGEGWSSVVGDGSRMDGALGRIRTGQRDRREDAPVKRSTRAARRVARPKPKPAPAVVAVADLSRRPRPPSLNAVLQQHYPPDARRRGQGGKAVVSARIDADGRIRAATVVSQSGPGFGQACVNTLTGSVWSPPLDRAGRPVATRISYTCQFRVNR
jgi:TonB family protein